MEDVGIFFGYLVYFTAFWYISWQFCIFYGYLVYILSFWYVVPRKIWQPRANFDRSTAIRTKLVFRTKLTRPLRMNVLEELFSGDLLNYESTLSASAIFSKRRSYEIGRYPCMYVLMYVHAYICTYV
jgi:hypothetical protein